MNYNNYCIALIPKLIMPQLVIKTVLENTRTVCTTSILLLFNLATSHFCTMDRRHFVVSLSIPTLSFQFASSEIVANSESRRNSEVME